MKEIPMDEHTLDTLIHETDSLIKIAEQKGHTPFTESAKVGMLRVHTYRLITTLQLLNVLPDDLHIKDGTLQRHEEIEEEE